MRKKLTPAEEIALKTIGGVIRRTLNGHDAASLSLKGFAQSRDCVGFELTVKGQRRLAALNEARDADIQESRNDR